MKKIFYLIILLQVYLNNANAQMFRWAIMPQYDKIEIAEGCSMLIGDSLSTKILWDLNGKRVGTTKDYIHNFYENNAVTTVNGTDKITGFYNSDGKFYKLDGDSVTYDYPYFSDGYLLVKSNNNYRYINKEGEEASFGTFVKMYPFSNGFASCLTYESIEKRKSPYYCYITTDKRLIEFKYNEKSYEKEDVEFLSSINDEGVGIAIIKHKLFYFNITSCSLEPIFANKQETNIKRQLVVDSDRNKYYLDTNDSIIIRGLGHKKEYVTFVFDKRLRPLKIYFSNDSTIIYNDKETKKNVYDSSIASFKSEDNKFGLTYNKSKILPAQFENISHAINDYVIVCKNHKWGMIKYEKDLKYNIIINEGKDISFRHKDVSTSIKLELPAIISADKCRFNIDEKYGCHIDKLSIETKNTENGNYVLYKCKLTIPDSLPDVLTDITYPVKIKYDDIEYPTSNIKTKAWHYKYINVDIDDETKVVNEGNLTFNINISVDKQPGENDYPFEPQIMSDTLHSELHKISETRYKCHIFNLAEGLNNITISIIEEGCPPSIFSYEITYNKPVKKSRNKPAIQENVKIEKKITKKKEIKKELPYIPI